MQIKICGITDPKLAYEAAVSRADFIGLVFHRQSRRAVDIDQAIKIAKAAKEGGALPVAVFTTHTAEEMQTICFRTGINIIQLQGDISRNQHYLLPKQYLRFYVREVTADGRTKEEGDVIPGIEDRRDYVLFDNHEPGKGTSFCWDNFRYNGKMKFGLAGGLNPNNVQQALEKIKPHLVDVSTGVEDTLGRKDILLIKEFIRVVRSK